MPVCGRFIVVYGGAMYWAQDLETVIDAAYLLRHDKDICFLIMGDGPTKENIVRRSRLLGLQNVLIMPLQPRDIYLNIIATASVCLVPLRKGYSSPTLPSKIPELMSMGKPIIASAVSESEVGRLFAEAQCGLLVAPGDPKSLAASILTLKEKPELAKALGENGKRYAESHFSANSSIELYASLLMNASKKMQQLH
jgi:colanic acid biosynthesis glycosyl transferase WcaI